MLKERIGDWTRFSHSLGSTEPMMVPVTQAIGWLDLELLETFPEIEKNAKTPQGMIELTKYFGKSQLWVLGAYEIIRSLHEKIKGKNLPLENKIFETKRKFSRIRIPLAKFESEKTNKEDFDFPQILVKGGEGAAWKVNKDLIITRKELADSFLELLEKIYISIKK